MLNDIGLRVWLGVFDSGRLNTMTGLLSTSGLVEITLFVGPSCTVLIREFKNRLKEQEDGGI